MICPPWVRGSRIGLTCLPACHKDIVILFFVLVAYFTLFENSILYMVWICFIVFVSVQFDVVYSSQLLGSYLSFFLCIDSI